ncbi:hypothetical protein [Actinomadura rugatobispora]|uniref:Uncharacterized protein n=1 Tax=Actinomadura rugatobispora TaxID=1994 RepID=A0ABW0ZQX9_9ACTN|nr:hypothetical protein GCM10010200_044530 [Actinomadura rugatobispora]
MLSRSQGHLQGGVDGDRQSAGRLASLVASPGQVIVKPDEDFPLGQGLLAGVNSSEGVREARASVLALPG